jgi:hypothetical protein
MLVTGSPQALARKAPAKTTERNDDRIDVVGHIALDGSGVTGLITGQHWRRNYLYLNSAGKITVVDVTDGTKPRVTAERRYSAPSDQTRARLVVGDAALVEDGSAGSSNAPRSVSIMTFTDPAKPVVVRQFANITGFYIDERRGFVYLVNPEGLWILNEKPGRDIELEKEYDRQILYNH